MSDRPSDLGTFRRYTWWAVPGTVACLLPLIAGDWLVTADLPSWARLTGTAALLVAVLSAVVLLSGRISTGRPPAGGAWLAAGSAAATVLGALALAWRELGLWGVAPAMMVACAATVLSARGRRTLLVTALLVAPIPGGLIVVLDGSGDLASATLFPIGLVAFTTWVTLGPLWAWDLAARLNQARRLSAELAVKDERLRFAADLHDIQGHHLQVIALKSELASRLAATDPERAASEMHEVNRLATDALRDTRAVVQGYRRTTLADEMTNATRVLSAADIDARLTSPPADLAGTTRHLLGLVMREATTNLLRHSAARHAEIDLHVGDGLARLRVANDGARDDPSPSGTGLTTLNERLRTSGGTLTWTRDGDRFEVTATLPADPEAQ